MVLRSIISRFFELRAFLVCAALVSLFVSNNVGPCFLPLPGVTGRVLEHRRNLQDNVASRSSSRDRSDSFRVPMMGQAQKRADKEHHAQPIVSSSTAGIVPPDDAPVAVELSLHFFYLPSVSVSQPPGRAPPRLV